MAWAVFFAIIFNGHKWASPSPYQESFARTGEDSMMLGISTLVPGGLCFVLLRRKVAGEARIADSACIDFSAPMG